MDVLLSLRDPRCSDRSVRLWDTTTTLEFFQLRLGIQALAVVWGALGLSVPAGTSPVVLKFVDQAPPSC
jgi:hypothetical protein